MSRNAHFDNNNFEMVNDIKKNALVVKLEVRMIFLWHCQGNGYARYQIF